MYAGLSGEPPDGDGAEDDNEVGEDEEPSADDELELECASDGGLGADNSDGEATGEVDGGKADTGAGESENRTGVEADNVWASDDDETEAFMPPPAPPTPEAFVERGALCWGRP